MGILSFLVKGLKFEFFHMDRFRRHLFDQPAECFREISIIHQHGPEYLRKYDNLENIGRLF